MEQLLTIAAVAERTQLSQAFWRRAVSRRLMPAVRIGRAVRLRERDVARFLSDGTPPAREEDR